MLIYATIIIKEDEVVSLRGGVMGGAGGSRQEGLARGKRRGKRCDDTPHVEVLSALKR